MVKQLLSLLGKTWPLVLGACPIMFKPLNDYLTQLACFLGVEWTGYILFVLLLGIVHISVYCYTFYAKARNLNDKLNENFKNFLEPVSGKGYSIDTRFNEPVCPACANQGKETFLRFLPARFTDAHDILMCDVCKHIIGLDTCAAKED